MNITPESVAAMTEKVFIAIPQHELGRYVAFETQLDRVICPPYTMKQRLCGIYISNNQNALARMFLDTECEYFWLLNDDQAYPPDTLLRLLAHQKDVVTPLCLEKASPHFPLIYGPANDGKRERRYLKRGEHGLIPLPNGACGGGGMLIHRRVFERIPDPWWTVSSGKTDLGFHEQSSEDFDFCTRVNEAGFTIYCDLDASVVHMALYGLRAQMDESGQWHTLLLRESEQVVIPAAAPPKSEIQLATSIPRPDREYWKQKQAQGRA